MGSIHWVLFSCLSLAYDIKNILEIGTFDGETAHIMSEIFPDGNITTLDLPDDDPILASSYQRVDPHRLKAFKEIQGKNVQHPRIEFVQANSFFAPKLVDKKFDLIWIDGGHLYPEVAWDICNAYHLCNPDGWIMCDDVIPHMKGVRDEYVSPDSYFVLEYIRQRTGEEVVYFLKREGAEWSANPYKRKYVSLMRKLDI